MCGRLMQFYHHSPSFVISSYSFYKRTVVHLCCSEIIFLTSVSWELADVYFEPPSVVCPPPTLNKRVEYVISFRVPVRASTFPILKICMLGSSHSQDRSVLGPPTLAGIRSAVLTIWLLVSPSHWCELGRKMGLKSLWVF